MKRLISLVVSVLVLSGLFVAPSFGAGGSDDTNLGGWFNNNTFPRISSSADFNGTTAYANLWMDFDASTTTLSSATWNFYTSPSDTSFWTATCAMHGLRSGSTPFGQKSWNQSYADGKVSLNAWTNVNCYDMYAGQISDLQSQIAALQKQWESTPGNTVDDLLLQIQALQLQLNVGELQANDKQILHLGAGFSIAPSKDESFNLNYNNTIDNVYSWPNGYDHDPVVTQVPSWTAQLYMYGQFDAPTIGEARAMGAQFQQVPEPTSICMLLGFAIFGGVIFWRKR
jgi:hypothetical protein